MPAGHADSFAAMTGLLERQISALEKLLEVLAHERDALLHRDADALAQAAQCKQALLASVGELEQQRQVLAPDGMESVTAQSGRVGALVERLFDLGRRCREQNESNGRLIHRQRRRVESTLQLLRGRPAAGDTVYGPDGSRASGGPASQWSVRVV